MSDASDRREQGLASLEERIAEFKQLHAAEHGADIATLWRAVEGRTFRLRDGTAFTVSEVSVSERIARGHLLHSVTVADGPHACAIGMGRSRKEAVNEALRKAAEAPLAEHPADVERTTADGTGPANLNSAFRAVEGEDDP